jgi:hypothetical protein
MVFSARTSANPVLLFQAQQSGNREYAIGLLNRLKTAANLSAFDVLEAVCPSPSTWKYKFRLPGDTQTYELAKTRTKLGDMYEIQAPHNLIQLSCGGLGNTIRYGPKGKTKVEALILFDRDAEAKCSFIFQRLAGYKGESRISSPMQSFSPAQLQALAVLARHDETIAARLKCEAEITPEVLRAAKRRLNRRYHTDHNPGIQSALGEINQAFEQFKESAS